MEFINTRERNTGVHVDIINKKTCAKLENFYKILGDNTRLNILYLLRQHELCVHELASELGISHSLACHQLKILKDNKLVISRKRGKESVYSLADDHIHEIIDIAIEHVTEGEKNHETRI